MRWNKNSGVMPACQECEGAGYVPAARRPSIHDPYPENPCDCGLGPHDPMCEVCGCTIEVAGFDCIACDTVANLANGQVDERTITEITAAIVRAAQAARGEAC